jgi:hypothetical protein
MAWQYVVMAVLGGFVSGFLARKKMRQTMLGFCRMTTDLDQWAAACERYCQVHAPLLYSDVGLSFWGIAQ